MSDNQNSGDDQSEQSKKSEKPENRATKGNRGHDVDRRSGGFSGHSDNHDRGRLPPPDKDENEHATEYGIGLAGWEPVPDEVDDPAHDLAGPAGRDHDNELTDGKSRPYIVVGIIVTAILVLAVAAIALFAVLAESGPFNFCAGDELVAGIGDGSEAEAEDCDETLTPE